MPAPVTAPAVSVNAVPVHIFVDDGVILATVGNAFTVTAVELTRELVHPVPA